MRDLNSRPPAYKTGALTNWANWPLHRVRFELTRIAPQDLKTCALTTRPSMLGFVCAVFYGNHCQSGCETSLDLNQKTKFLNWFAVRKLKLQGVRIELTRIAPQDLKTCTLTTRSSLLLVPKNRLLASRKNYLIIICFSC
jgi:hypothetical protein